MKLPFRLKPEGNELLLAPDAFDGLLEPTVPGEVEFLKDAGTIRTTVGVIAFTGIESPRRMQETEMLESGNLKYF